MKRKTATRRAKTAPVVTFEKPAASFVLSCLDYKRKGTNIYNRAGLFEFGERAKCRFCGEEMTLSNLAGIVKGGLLCKKLPCLMAFAGISEDEIAGR